MDKASELMKIVGAKIVMKLPVSSAFHTKMLESAAQKLNTELENIEFNDIIVPIITNVTADYVERVDKVKDLLTRQVTSPVLWEDTINKMIEDGVDTFIEIGPGKALSGFIKRIDKTKRILNVEDVVSLENVIKEMGLC